MLLTKIDIAKNNIVAVPNPQSQRETTYDATVGEIIFCGKTIEEKKFTLPSRGVVWVVSNEEFTLPSHVTGLATLRTTWTHDGVLALNVGVIDPGWSGPVATALVNFSKNSFEVVKGEQFFRILFTDHVAATTTPHPQTKQAYVADIARKSKAFSPEFLNMDSLKKEVAEEIFTLPRWAVILGILALAISVIAIFVPISWSVGTEHYQGRARVEALEKEIQDLKQVQSESKKLQDELKTQQDLLKKQQSVLIAKSNRR